MVKITKNKIQQIEFPSKHYIYDFIVVALRATNKVEQVTPPRTVFQKKMRNRTPCLSRNKASTQQDRARASQTMLRPAGGHGLAARPERGLV